MEKDQRAVTPERFASGMTFPQYLIYHKDRLVNEHIRAPRAGETPTLTRERGDREFPALQQSPFFRIWACAGIDEILSALHERLAMAPSPDPAAP